MNSALEFHLHIIGHIVQVHRLLENIIDRTSHIKVLTVINTVQLWASTELLLEILGAENQPVPIHTTRTHYNWSPPQGSILVCSSAWDTHYDPVRSSLGKQFQYPWDAILTSWRSIQSKYHCIRPQRPPKMLNKTLKRHYTNNRLSDNDLPRWVRKKTILSLILWVRTSWVVIFIVSNTSTLQRAIGAPLELRTASRRNTDCAPSDPEILLSPQRFPSANSTSATPSPFPQAPKTS